MSAIEAVFGGPGYAPPQGAPASRRPVDDSGGADASGLGTAARSQAVASAGESAVAAPQPTQAGGSAAAFAATVESHEGISTGPLNPADEAVEAGQDIAATMAQSAKERAEQAERAEPSAPEAAAPREGAPPHRAAQTRPESGADAEEPRAAAPVDAAQEGDPSLLSNARALYEQSAQKWWAPGPSPLLDQAL